MEEVLALVLAVFLGVSSVVSGSVKVPQTPQQVGYGRMLFVGDSRSVDMFDKEESEIMAGKYNGITVYCKNCAQYNDMISWIEHCGMDNFDTLVTWMGCNEHGDFGEYGAYYDSLIAQGKKIVVCTIGPTDDEYLANDFDRTYYVNDLMVKFNNSLTSWAKERGVKIIDLYSYINNSSTVYPCSEDGVHFYPQPTTELWELIVANLKY